MFLLFLKETNKDCCGQVCRQYFKNLKSYDQGTSLQMAKQQSQHVCNNTTIIFKKKLSFK
jgi:hypothetical protein